MPIEKWSSLLIALAALSGAAGVAEAAYAAHGSPEPLLQTSSQFLVLHAAAVIAIAAAAQAFLDHDDFALHQSKTMNVIASNKLERDTGGKPVLPLPHPALAKPRFMLLAGALLLFGTILFCGDLSARAMTGSRLFPMAAPLGGSLMIAGWIGTALAALLRPRRPPL
jgi:uncharacterized membrane protein YgdD (TMEM256/DUF423 family)